MVRRANAIQEKRDLKKKAFDDSVVRCIKCRRSFSEEKAKASAMEMYKTHKKEVAPLGEQHGRFWEVMCGVCIRSHVQSLGISARCKCKECGRIYDTEALMSEMADYAKDPFIVSDVIQPLAQKYDRPWESICISCFRSYVERAIEDVEGMTYDVPIDDD